jgi:hypothetical protein
MSALHEAIGARLCSLLEARSRWDEPPELLLITVPLPGEPLLLHVPVPIELWSIGARSGHRVPDVLADIAAMIASPAASRPRSLMYAMAGGRQRVHGVVFRHEGYGISTATAVPEALRRAHDDAVNHRIGDRPDAVELRMAYGTDRDGYTYAVRQLRGEPAVPLVIGPDDTDLLPTGYVLESLDTLLAGLTRRPPPKRPSAEDGWDRAERTEEGKEAPGAPGAPDWGVW